MRNPIVLKRIGDAETQSGGLFQRAFRRFRLPLRQTSEIDQTAAQNRAERLFEVNFRTSWTR